MAEPFLGEIRQFAFNIIPKGWMRCEGQVLNVSANTALFSLLGNAFGGDGKTTFALPDLRGRAIVDEGQNPNLTNRTRGQSFGTEGITLTGAQMPIHNHMLGTNAMATLKCKNTPANSKDPGSNSISANAAGDQLPMYNTADADTALNAGSIVLSGNTDNTGGSAAHNNMQPFLTCSYCIAITGIYPTRP
jgi:microcystin-dependent protein